jgi:hypothetical protein
MTHCVVIILTHRVMKVKHQSIFSVKVGKSHLQFLTIFLVFLTLPHLAHILHCETGNEKKYKYQGGQEVRECPFSVILSSSMNAWGS